MPDGCADLDWVLHNWAGRLCGYGSLTPQDIDAIAHISGEIQTNPRGRDLTEPAGAGPQIILAGWACQMRAVGEQRRQIFGFFLPGDVIGSFWGRAEFAFCRTMALTRLRTISAQPLLTRDGEGRLAYPAVVKAARRAEDHAQHRLFNQMVRLGGRDAYGGLAHLLLELYARLQAAGLADDGAFNLPIGQRVLAQALGFSVAHTNHTLQRMAADGLVAMYGGAMRLLQPDRMAEVADFAAPSAHGLVPSLNMDGMHP